MGFIECVPNVSEGRRSRVVESLASAVRGVVGARLLDYSADAAHHRSVFTFIGGASAVQTAVVSMFGIAISAIDLRTHRGEHPRIGAIDVVPFVPVGNAALDDCVLLARAMGAVVAERFQIPVYLYEAAARRPERRSLSHIRRGGFEGLAEKMRLREWAPDYGPAAPHPSAGATAIGARMPLVAFNVNLATDQVDIARHIAAAVRELGGGLRAVKALGLMLQDRGIAQVSMNLTDYHETSLPVAFEAVAREAARYGVGILESEIVGLVPEGAFAGSTPEALKLGNFSGQRILERALNQLRTP
jgi:glutamate formiminotransferase